MTTAFNKICRICSSPADYEIFAKIPSYLHANSNEFLNNNWQKPINILLEETTGLKVTNEDELPGAICAICISYLKHAVTFREQAINNTMALKAIQLLSAKCPKLDSNSETTTEDKASELITAQDLLWAEEERQVDANLLLNNLQQDQDKVRKQLLNNNRQCHRPTAQNVEEQMRYLNLLFNKDSNSGLTPKRRNIMSGMATGYQLASAGSGGDGDGEEEFPTTTSSDDNEDVDATNGKQKLCNIFSYQEKNFEEDDIMDLDELRDAIKVNVPESCKERKCRACSRRFMFEDSYKEHMNTCIEYMFLIFIEELNRLLEIRRNKAISPHEFIRRMIFALRKTCDWLKSNCGDMLLPDLSNNETQKKRAQDSDEKVISSDEQKQTLAQQIERTPSLTVNERLAKLVEGHQMRNKTKSTSDFKSVGCKTIHYNDPIATKDILLHDESDSTNLFVTPKTKPANDCVTPISMSNNILYEIERSQSRNSNQPISGNDLDLGSPLQQSSQTQLKKPIALLATGNVITTTTTTTTATINITNTPQKLDDGKENSLPDAERLTFLQKLKKAASETPPTNANGINSSQRTPIIQVRKDLLPSTKVITPPPLIAAHVQPIAANSTPPIVPLTPTANKFSARCNPCDLIFETLAALEMHNAMKHNNMIAVSTARTRTPESGKSNNPMMDLDAERKKIIALFEEDDDI